MKLFVCVFIIIFFLTSELNAQATSWEWAQSAGSTKFDAGSAITDDASGNIFVAGTFSDSATFGNATLIAAGSQDVMVVKYDPFGGIIWAKGFGGALSDRAFGISTDNARNVYVTGSSNSPELIFAGDTLYTCGFYIAKLDSMGNEEWIRSSTGLSDVSTGNAIDADYLGNTYVTGKFNSDSLSFGTIILLNNGIEDMFIARYDALGNFLWARDGGYTGSEYGSGVSIDNSGSACVTGTFWGDSITFGNTTLYNAGSVNVFTVKYDVLGTVLWAKSANNVSGISGIWAGAIVADGSGNMYITGTLAGFGVSFGNYTLSTSGQGDVFVTKYGPSGNVLWARKGGGNANEYANGISFDSDGNSYVTGTYESAFFVFGTTTIYNSGIRNVFVMKFGPSGIPLWATNGEGNYSDWGQAICTTINNETYLTGEFRSQGITFGTIDLSNATSDSVADYFIAKLGISVALPAEIYFPNKLITYPNPFTHEITIVIQNNEVSLDNVYLTDVIGRPVNYNYIGYKSSTTTTLDVKQLRQGVYFLKIIIDGDPVVKMVIKE